MPAIRAFVTENGLFMSVMKYSGGVVRRLRDGLIARRLKTNGMRMGKFPRVQGLKHIEMGANFSANNGLWLEAVTEFAGVRYEPHIKIGDNVSFSDFVHVGCTNRVEIGEGVLSGSHVLITDHAHGSYAGTEQSSPATRPTQRKLSNDKSVLIGCNVWLGDGVVVLGGASIGDGCIVGANSVVNSAIPAYCIAVGSPARPIRRWDNVRQEWVRWGDAEA